MRTETDVTGEWSRPAGEDPPGVRIVDAPAQGAVDMRIPVATPILLGRDPGPKGLTLCDPRVSSVHLTLYPGDAGEVLFRDMGSKNGTFHNGRRAVGGRLVEGDVLRLGSTLLVATRRGPGVDFEAPERGFVGQSPRFREACQRAAEAARTPAPVLLLGESGSGKEGMARFVHEQSGRRGPFIAVNCATLHDHMATAALFGHERGAFTGAVVGRRGHFREADGGTLFLDEIGDLPLDIQPRLLRALEQREITPVGAARPLTVDVRVIAATNADLRARVAADRFRGDLFARLDGCPIELAPLRGRKEDILRLARHFCGRQPAQVPFGDPMFEADLAEVLLLYGWPFNARELRQVVAWLHLDGALPLRFDRLPRRIIDAAVPPSPGAAPEELAGATRTAPQRVAEAHRRRVRPSQAELEEALASHGYSISAVARLFGRDRKQIYRWVEHYGIALPSGPAEP